MDFEKEREVREAIAAGERALSNLREAKEMLNKAGNWGLVDMLGGGAISAYMKYSKMDVAQQKIDAARRALRDYGRELRDVADVADIRIEVSDFLQIADYFWDNAGVDFLVQRRIKESKRKVDEAIEKIEQLQARLWAM